jgi:hypothetical protein
LTKIYKIVYNNYCKSITIKQEVNIMSVGSVGGSSGSSYGSDNPTTCQLPQMGAHILADAIQDLARACQKAQGGDSSSNTTSSSG